MSAPSAQSLHDHAVDRGESVSELLSPALSLATILRQKGVQAWLKQELHGYGAEDPLPDYRQGFQGTLVAWMPAHGWVEAPVSDEMRTEVSQFELRDDITALERAYAKNRKAGGQRLELPEARLADLKSKTQLDTQLNIAAPSSAFAEVLETVRITIELWADALIEAGVTQEAGQFRGEHRAHATMVSERLEEFQAQAAELAPQRLAQIQPQRSGFLSRMLGRA